jgi:SAM-dependent methyltransferase
LITASLGAVLPVRVASGSPPGYAPESDLTRARRRVTVGSDKDVRVEREAGFAMVRDFYDEVVMTLVRGGVLDPGMKVLVVCGGRTDRVVLERCGFRDVVISNLGLRPAGKDMGPFRWSEQDAERLTFDDESFDFAVVHSGLHHCHSPHRALLEMYRVARRGLVVFEPYDNLLTRLGVRLGIGQEYEYGGVAGEIGRDGHRGGVANTTIPNFVYRFTEREIIKAVHSYAPYARHDIRFFHRMRIPWHQLRRRRNRGFYLAVRLAQPALKLVEVVAPGQCNNFAAVILKPDLSRRLHPWLQRSDGAVEVNTDWLASRYRTATVSRTPPPRP